MAGELIQGHSARSKRQAAKQGPLLHHTTLLLMQQGTCRSHFEPLHNRNSCHLQHRRAAGQGQLHLTAATADSTAHLDLLGRLLGAVAAGVPFSSQALQSQVLGSNLLLAAPDFNAALLYLGRLQDGKGGVQQAVSRAAGRPEEAGLPGW